MLIAILGALFMHRREVQTHILLMAGSLPFQERPQLSFMEA